MQAVGAEPGEAPREVCLVHVVVLEYPGGRFALLRCERQLAAGEVDDGATGGGVQA